MPWNFKIPTMEFIIFWCGKMRALVITEGYGIELEDMRVWFGYEGVIDYEGEIWIWGFVQFHSKRSNSKHRNQSIIIPWNRISQTFLKVFSQHFRSLVFWTLSHLKSHLKNSKMCELLNPSSLKNFKMHNLIKLWRNLLMLDQFIILCFCYSVIISD